MSEGIPYCPKCKTPTTVQYQNVPMLHLSMFPWSEYTLRGKTKKRMVYSCPNCGAQYFNSLAFIEFKGDKIIKAYI